MTINSGSITQLADHFVNSAGDTLIRLQAAVSTADADAVNEGFEKIKSHPIVRLIADMVASSKAKANELAGMVREMGPFGDVLVGLTATVGGAIIWSSAAEIALVIAGAASAAAAAELLVVVGFALMAYGIVKCAKVLYRRLMQTAEGAFDSFFDGER